MFDWLKDLFDHKKKSAPKKPSGPTACGQIKVDSRDYPLINITPKAFVAGDADDNLIKDQNLSISVVVDDSCGKFTFNCRCTIVRIDSNRRFAGAFALLPPEVEQVLNQYTKNRAAQEARQAQQAQRIQAARKAQDAKGNKGSKGSKGKRS